MVFSSTNENVVGVRILLFLSELKLAEAVAHRSHIVKVFLKNSQNTQENISTKSLSSKKTETPAHAFS